MKILVVGAGGIGGYYGGVLARSGEDVTFLARGPHLDAIRRQGLRVESVNSGDFTVRAPATEYPDGAWKADLALFCVKSYHNEQAMEAMKPAIGDATAILTLQNGIGSGDQLAEVFGRENVLLGAAYIDAVRKSPGVVAELGGLVRIVFGEEHGRETTRAVRIRDALQRAGIDPVLTSDVSKELWVKLVLICGLSGMTCITRARIAEVLDTPETLALTTRVVQEAVDVGRARGRDFADDMVESTIAEYQAHKHEAISSMHVDLEAGNPIEVSVLNGAIARISKEVGVATPVNDFITACLTVADNRARSRLASASSA